MEWAKRLVDALHEAERAAADGGAYKLAEHLKIMAEPFAGHLADAEQVVLLAEVAGVERKHDDVCVVHVPPHWMAGLRAKAEVSLKA